jgi:hypothetical protein
VIEEAKQRAGVEDGRGHAGLARDIDELVPVLEPQIGAEAWLFDTVLMKAMRIDAEVECYRSGVSGRRLPSSVTTSNG